MTKLEHLLHDSKRDLARRWFLRDCGVGLGSIALASLLGERQALSAEPLAPRMPHFAPKAKSIIYLHMAGAPSQLDLFDYKPELKKRFKRDLSLQERNDWDAFVTQARARVATFTQTVTQAEREIDTLVYQLFDLNAEEIRLIEASSP